MRWISITTGDPDGIGLEVSLKALKSLGPQAKTQFVLWSHADKKIASSYLKKFEIVQVDNLKEALKVSPRSKQLIQIRSNSSPSEWVRESAVAGLNGEIQALCTGPLSKLSPGAGKGHTGIFRELCPNEELFMLFLGKEFNVVLLTDHIPVDQVQAKLKADKLKAACQNIQKFFDRQGKKKKPIGILGLNPHSGEEGKIGDEELLVLKPFIQKFRTKFSLEGPLVPDAAFLKANWKRYCAYLCLYHDQGLIPFKLVHGQSGGAQVTLGLPFIRTSVDHGTAKDIYGKNKADPGSMIDAIRWSIKLTAPE